MIKIIKNEQEWIIDINLPQFIKQLLLKGWQVLAFVVQSLNVITHHHTQLGIIMALGLGVGVGLTVFRSPDSLAASSNLFGEQPVVSSSPIKYVEFTNFLVIVKDKEKTTAGLLPQYQLQQVNLNQDNQIYLRANLILTNHLRQLNIGSQATLQYKDGQKKQVTLISIQTLAAEKILTATYQPQKQYVIYSPTNLLGDQIWVGIFR